MLIAESGYWILDTGYWILDAGCWMLDIFVFKEKNIPS
jgi:hypothetical protein